ASIALRSSASPWCTYHQYTDDECSDRLEEVKQGFTRRRESTNEEGEDRATGLRSAARPLHPAAAADRCGGVPAGDAGARRHAGAVRSLESGGEHAGRRPADAGALDWAGHLHHRDRKSVV